MRTRVICRFYPNQKNPQRASGRGVWRVVNCWKIHTRPLFLVTRFEDEAGPLLSVTASRLYRYGSRIDPRKALGV